MIVIGRRGMVASALADRQSAQLDVVRLGRPDIDLAAPDGLAERVAAARPDIVVNAAAWTDVDGAEAQEAEAAAVNAGGARAVAASARDIGVPLIHLSTDYVFDGTKPLPYVERDSPSPLNVYGRSKLAGERAVAAVAADHVILRTSWVYAAAGRNFLTTMLRLMAARPSVRVIDDRHGAPTAAADLARAIEGVARNLCADRDARLRGTFHATAAGATSWAGFAAAMGDDLRRHGETAADIVPIAWREWSEVAPRPANSRLDCGRLAACHGIAMPAWQAGLARELARYRDCAAPGSVRHPSSLRAHAIT